MKTVKASMKCLYSISSICNHVWLNERLYKYMKLCMKKLCSWRREESREKAWKLKTALAKISGQLGAKRKLWRLKAENGSMKLNGSQRRNSGEEEGYRLQLKAIESWPLNISYSGEPVIEKLISQTQALWKENILWKSNNKEKAVISQHYSVLLHTYTAPC